MVDKNLIDPELLIALDDALDFDIWDDLVKTRQVRLELAKSFDAHVSIMDQVAFDDHNAGNAGNNPDLRVRVYRPAKPAGPLPGLLWIHGGGYVMGTIDIEVPLVQRLVDAVGCVVVSVEYRLAPEHPYPAPLDDCYQALAWLFANATELGIDTESVAIGGISAGGGLAASVALMARDRGEYTVIFQLLMCPMLDDRNHLESTRLNLDGIGWTRRDNLNGWAAYLGGDYDVDAHAYAVPARIDDLSNLPPAYISIGTLDIFLDENMQYARRLMVAGVGCELHTFPRAMHAFQYRVPGATVSRRANHLIYETLKHAFNREPRSS